MTFGEMFAWTNRFKNIVAVGGELKNKRLENLKSDLETCYKTYGPNQNIYATGLYCRVCEEMRDKNGS